MASPPKKSSLPTFNHCFGIGAALAIDREVEKETCKGICVKINSGYYFHSTIPQPSEMGLVFRLERASRLVTERIMTGQQWSWVSLAANGKPSCFIWWKQLHADFSCKTSIHTISILNGVQPQRMRTLFGKFGKSNCLQFNSKGWKMFGMNPVPVWACCFFGASGGFLAFSNVRWRDVGNSEITACDSTSYNRGH